MSLGEIINHLKSSKTGCSIEDIRKKMDTLGEDSIKNIIKNGIDLNFIKKHGSGRNTRYYEINQKIVENNGVFDNSTFKAPAHGLNAIKEIENSLVPLQHIKEIMYEEEIKLSESKNKLSSFVSSGQINHTVRLHYNFIKKRNEIYKHEKKIKMNRVEITHDSDIDKFKISLYSSKNPSYPEEIYFNKFEELSDYLKKNW